MCSLPTARSNQTTFKHLMVSRTQCLCPYGGDRLVIVRLNTHQQVRDGEMDEEEGHPRLDASVAPQQNAAKNSLPDLSQ